MKWDNNIVYYDNDDVKYQIHSADRTQGENTGKWVCCFYTPDNIIQAKANFIEGYMGIKDGQIVFCGGNGLFCAIGLPLLAQYDSIEEAKKVCELHNKNPDNSRVYTFSENKKDYLKSQGELWNHINYIVDIADLGDIKIERNTAIIAINIKQPKIKIVVAPIVGLQPSI